MREAVVTQPEDHVILDPRVEIGTRRHTGRRRGQVDDLAAALAVGMRVINRFGFNPCSARQMEEANQRHLLEHVHGLVHRPQGGGRHLLCNPLEHRVNAHVGRARVNGVPRCEALRRHALAVETSVRWYARHDGEDEEAWGSAALLHDFDYEIHPTLDKHPQDGAAILREEGYPEEVIEAILSHAEHLELPRDTMLKKSLFACDELSGFVHACGLVRPSS